MVLGVCRIARDHAKVEDQVHPSEDTSRGQKGIMEQRRAETEIVCRDVATEMGNGYI